MTSDTDNGQHHRHLCFWHKIINGKKAVEKVDLTMLKTEKQEIIQKYARHEGDTGSPEVQIA
ncbi:MAG: hypothetical protein R3Y33_06995, partial [Clostridia bacterium]